MLELPVREQRFFQGPSSGTDLIVFQDATLFVLVHLSTEINFIIHR